MDEKLVDWVVREILKSLPASSGALQPDTAGMELPLEVSARHVHLSQGDVECLFGPGHTLTPKRDLSQPGQFLCEERVRLVGPKGEIASVAVLGPARTETQAELSRTDARSLGVDAPLRMSGDLRGAADLLVFAKNGFIEAKNCAIVAKNHIHMTPADAQTFGVTDRQSVRVKVHSGRPLIFDDVVVRVDDSFRLAMHIDVDEANASLADCGCRATLMGGGAGAAYLSVPAAPVAATAAAAPAPCCGERVITEAVAKRLASGGVKSITLPCNAIITPLAQDVFRAAGVTAAKGERA